MLEQKKEENREVACVVVAVGYDACRLVKAIPRTGYWRLLAVGQDAQLADADRTIAPDDGQDLHDWSKHVIEALDGEWRDAGFVCVVYDERDLECSALAAMILAAARTPERVGIAMLLGHRCECGFERQTDLTIRPSRTTSGPDGRALGADALRVVLGPFESCAIPHALDAVAVAMRELGEGMAIARRTHAEASPAHALAELFGDPAAERPCFVHLTLAPNTPARLGELAAEVERRGFWETAITLSIDETFANGDVLVGAIVPIVRRPRGGVGARLRALVEERGASLLPRDERARTYAARLTRELAWWTADDELCKDTLTLLDVVEIVRAAGGIIGPGLRRSGGSLVAFVLGLTVFDPITWELSFDNFLGRHAPLVIELTASRRACERHDLPGYPFDQPHRHWAFGPDPILDELECVATRPFTWQLTDERDEAALASIATSRQRFPVDDSGVCFFREYPEALRDVAPTTLEELAAAIAIVRPGPIHDGLVDFWSCDCIPNDAALVPGSVDVTRTTRGWLIYEEQVNDVLARLLATTACRARMIRRQLAKDHGRCGPRAEPLESDMRMWPLAPENRPQVVSVLRSRSGTAYSRGHALSEALTRLALAREVARR